MVIEDAFSEIERRIEACDGHYPFEVDSTANALHSLPMSGDIRHLAYKCLLLATRLNMSSNRIHAGIDGTKLMEYISANVARQYLGARAESLVFGTAESAPDFPQRVESLCHSIGEGGGFEDGSGNSRRIRDDKLDVVAWKAFADRREGKLIAFGQCKTGTNWRSEVTQLQPGAFCKKWFRSQPVLEPLRMFFISEALPSVDWRNRSVDAGLLFDRCRIVDFFESIDVDLLEGIEAWTVEAARATELPDPLG